MSKHLSLSERVMIERGRLLGNLFKVIGRMIGRSPTPYPESSETMEQLYFHF